jgi:hypothetical protein
LREDLQKATLPIRRSRVRILAGAFEKYVPRTRCRAPIVQMPPDRPCADSR